MHTQQVWTLYLFCPFSGNLNLYKGVLQQNQNVLTPTSGQKTGDAASCSSEHFSCIPSENKLIGAGGRDPDTEASQHLGTYRWTEWLSQEYTQVYAFQKTTTTKKTPNIQSTRIGYLLFITQSMMEPNSIKRSASHHSYDSRILGDADHQVANHIWRCTWMCVFPTSKASLIHLCGFHLNDPM